MSPDLNDINNFWFNEVGPSRWFDADPALDYAVLKNFESTYLTAIDGKLRHWESNSEGMLALILLSDVFPQRMYRGTAQAYATLDLALDFARIAIINHFDDRIDRSFKLFFYTPFVNSEYMGDQRLALFYIRERTKRNEWLAMAEQSFDLIHRFGRFPERNAILGRESTPEELAYLKGKQPVSEPVPSGLDAALAFSGSPA
jgi:uncharacterized protein (DUF924 family)